MALIGAPPPASRTSPTKLATPPMRVSSAIRRSISLPGSKSSRCTLIMDLAPGHGREERDLVAGRNRVVEPGVVLVHRGPHHGEVLERLAVAGTPVLEPVHQL